MNWKNALLDYQHYLKIERGLSQNSNSSYSNDVKKLIRYIEENELQYTPLSITEAHLQQFIYQTAKTVNARTQARLISGLRNFFEYLVRFLRITVIVFAVT